MSIIAMESSAYISYGELPQFDAPDRSPSIRREPKLSGNNLRNLYQSSSTQSEQRMPGDLHLKVDTATPILPPTPPHVDGEGNDDEPSSSDTTRIRSVLVTPVNQLSPPTPDMTPPRHQHSQHLLGARPSMTSTYAESFKTAREDISSDNQSSLSLPMSRHTPLQRHSPLALASPFNHHKPSPLIQTSFFALEAQSPEPAEIEKGDTDRVHGLYEETQQQYADSPVIPHDMFPQVRSVEDILTEPSAVSPQSGMRRGLSLKERLEESQSLPRSRSLDKFANIIGWNDGVQAGESKRWSAVSASTISAIVVDQPQMSKRRGTLRHVSKNDSLRSTSSPLPPTSQPASQNSLGTPHKLSHKKARLSNRHRESFGSDHSRSFSFSTTPPKLEVIRVAVIPERMSSLQPSRPSTRRHSTSTTSAPFRVARGSENNVTSARASTEAADRGRNRYYPPQVGPFTVPVRSSSLSAPTSRTTSRANSLNSESIRSARKQAENDLRNTLNQMETDRLASSLQNLATESRPETPKHRVVRAHDFAAGVEAFPEHEMDNAARPLSAKVTLYSAPSFLSASPEINEARVVSFFPHNNHSIQLIEPFPQPESNAVQSMRLQYADRGHADSPFRDPRVAPVPPQMPVSAAGKLAHTQLNGHPQRASAGLPARENSITRTVMRTVSLRHARNRKAHQQLDSASHPMWRPRPFWDDADAQKRRAEEQEQRSQDRELVQNSVGIPQSRGGLIGPVALMHRISNRRRNRKAIVKQSSFTSLHRLRTGRRLYRIPGLGVNLQLMSIKHLPARLAQNRLRREEERREHRRDELRKAIGSNVISTGDSRFPSDTL